MNVIAVIADIVDSKQITDRGVFQQKLEKKLDSINKKSAESIISPYTITIGDEFQVLYKSAETIFADIWDIIEYIFPYKLRISIGYDKILTRTNKERAIGMDGPAFHYARDGLVRLKKYKKTVIQVYSSGIPAIELVNTSLLLVFDQAEKWKENTLKIFASMIKNNDIQSIAENISISERAVYKSIKSNNLKTIKELLEEISNQIRKGTEN